MGAGAIGVEDARHLDPEPVLAAVVEEQRLGAALALVVARARADGVHVAPIAFRLRVHRGVAVDLAGGRLEDLGPRALGEAEHVDGADHAGLGGLHGVALVMDGRCRAGEVVDLVHLDEQRERHIVPHQLEIAVVVQVRDVARRSREEIVHAQHVAPGVQQAFAKMGAQEASTACHEHTTLKMQCTAPKPKPPTCYRDAAQW